MTKAVHDTLDLKSIQNEISEIVERNNWSKTKRLFDWIVSDSEVDSFFKAANIFALYLNYNDHGRSHGVITGRNAIRIYELLKDSVPPSIVEEGFGDEDDTALIILASAMLHDIGMAIHRSFHYHHSSTIAFNLLKPQLEKIYPEVEKRTIVLSHILHGIYSHDEAVDCLTVEAGIVTIADGLDMAHGRSRGPYKRNKTDIHSISAQSINEVIISSGVEKPILVEVHMKNPAGVFQLEEILLKKMMRTSVRKHVKIVAYVNGDRINLPRLSFNGD